MKFIGRRDANDVIYDLGTIVESVDARLKDEYVARFLRVRGSIKVKCYLMFGIVALADDQILRVASFGQRRLSRAATRNNENYEEFDHFEGIRDKRQKTLAHASSLLDERRVAVLMVRAIE